MARTRDDALAWVERGTQLLIQQIDAMDERDLCAPSGLPGWTRKHVVAHVAANADALGNLVHWARTGERTPMYASAAQRLADIEAGAGFTADKLSAWVNASARDLAAALDGLTEAQWQHEVVTAQGRTVPATEIPWMRAREVCVHAADLATDVSFADLPDQFLSELVTDIQVKRGLDALPDGPLHDVAAYLAGRPHALTDVPDLGPWL